MKRPQKIFPILRDARCAELNALDFLEVAPPEMDWRQAVYTLAGIVGKVADDLEGVEDLSEKVILNHLRWILLFETPGVSVHQKETGEIQIHRATKGIGGSYRELIGKGQTIVEAVDAALGITKAVPKWDEVSDEKEDSKEST